MVNQSEDENDEIILDNVDVCVTCLPHSNTPLSLVSVANDNKTSREEGFETVLLSSTLVKHNQELEKYSSSPVYENSGNGPDRDRRVCNPFPLLGRRRNQNVDWEGITNTESLTDSERKENSSSNKKKSKIKASDSSKNTGATNEQRRVGFVDLHNNTEEEFCGGFAVIRPIKDGATNRQCEGEEGRGEGNLEWYHNCSNGIEYIYDPRMYDAEDFTDACFRIFDCLLGVMENPVGSTTHNATNAITKNEKNSSSNNKYLLTPLPKNLSEARETDIRRRYGMTSKNPSPLVSVCGKGFTSPSELKIYLDENPEMCQVITEKELNLPLHALCLRGLSIEGSKNVHSFSPALFQESNRRREKDEEEDEEEHHLAIETANDLHDLLKILLDCYEEAAHLTNIKGDLPVHLLSRQFMYYALEGPPYFEMEQVHEIKKKCIELVLDPLVHSLDSCSHTGSIGCMLPIHIATYFNVEYDLLYKLLLSYPMGASVKCTFLEKDMLPIDLLELLHYSNCSSQGGISARNSDSEEETTFTSAAASSSFSTLSSTESSLRMKQEDDYNKKSDLLFSFNPDLLPYRADPKRLRRLEQYVRNFALLHDTIKDDEDQEESIIAVPSKLVWIFFCTFENPSDETDHYAENVYSIIKGLNKESFNKLVFMRYEKHTSSSTTNSKKNLELSTNDTDSSNDSIVIISTTIFECAVPPVKRVFQSYYEQIQSTKLTLPSSNNNNNNNTSSSSNLAQLKHRISSALLKSFQPNNLCGETTIQSVNTSTASSSNHKATLNLHNKQRDHVFMICLAKFLFHIPEHYLHCPTSFVILPYAVTYQNNSEQLLQLKHPHEDAIYALRFAEKMLKVNTCNVILDSLQQRATNTNNINDDNNNNNNTQAEEQKLPPKKRSYGEEESNSSLSSSSSYYSKQRAQQTTEANKVTSQEMNEAINEFYGCYRSSMGYFYFLDELSGVPVVSTCHEVKNPVELVQKVLPLMQLSILLMRGCEKALFLMAQIIVTLYFSESPKLKSKSHWLIVFFHVIPLELIERIRYSQEQQDYSSLYYALMDFWDIITKLKENKEYFQGKEETISWTQELTILQDIKQNLTTAPTNTTTTNKVNSFHFHHFMKNLKSSKTGHILWTDVNNSIKKEDIIEDYSVSVFGEEVMSLKHTAAASAKKENNLASNFSFDADSENEYKKDNAIIKKKKNSRKSVTASSFSSTKSSSLIKLSPISSNKRFCSSEKPEHSVISGGVGSGFMSLADETSTVGTENVIDKEVLSAMRSLEVTNDTSYNSLMYGTNPLGTVVATSCNSVSSLHTASYKEDTTIPENSEIASVTTLSSEKNEKSIDDGLLFKEYETPTCTNNEDSIKSPESEEEKEQKKGKKKEVEKDDTPHTIIDKNDEENMEVQSERMIIAPEIKRQHSESYISSTDDSITSSFKDLLVEEEVHVFEPKETEMISSTTCNLRVAEELILIQEDKEQNESEFSYSAINEILPSSSSPQIINSKSCIEDNADKKQMAAPLDNEASSITLIDQWMSAIRTLSSGNDDEEFMKTVKDLMAEDIVADYEYRSMSYLSKNHESSEGNENEERSTRSSHNYSLDLEYLDNYSLKSPIIEEKKFEHVDTIAEKKENSKVANRDNSAALRNLVNIKEEKTSQESLMSDKLSLSKNKFSQQEIQESKFQYYSDSDSIKENITKVKMDGLNLEAKFSELQKAVEEKLNHGTTTAKINKSNESQKGSSKIEKHDLYAELQEFEDEEIRLLEEKEKLISSLHSELANYRDLVDLKLQDSPQEKKKPLIHSSKSDDEETFFTAKDKEDRLSLSVTFEESFDEKKIYKYQTKPLSSMDDDKLLSKYSRDDDIEDLLAFLEMKEKKIMEFQQALKESDTKYS